VDWREKGRSYWYKAQAVMLSHTKRSTSSSNQLDLKYSTSNLFILGLPILLAIMSVLQSWTNLVQPVLDTLKQSLDNPNIDYRKFVVGAGWAICGLETYIL
jgi:hypothetical protein